MFGNKGMSTILLKELREKSHAYLTSMYQHMGNDSTTDFKLKCSIAKAIRLNDNKWGQTIIDGDWDRDSEEY